MESKEIENLKPTNETENSLSNDIRNEIAVFSGSFNPLHEGHKTIIRSLNDFYKKTIVSVTPLNPLKEENSFSTYDERLSAMNGFLKEENLGSVEVTDIESKKEPPYYTYDLLNEIKKLYPNEKIRFVIGGDCLENFLKWDHCFDIIKDFGILIISRPGYEEYSLLNDILKFNSNSDDEDIIIWDLDCPDISSTKIREDAVKEKKTEKDLQK